MRFTALFAVATAVLFASSSLSTAIRIPGSESPLNISLPVASRDSSELLFQRSPKRPKYHKRPRPHPQRPHHHPTNCVNTNLVKNGDFNKNVKTWEFLRGSSAQFFWVKDSKKRPSHSGGGQGYLFLNRGYASAFLTTIIPAVEYGNTVTISAWLRYEAPNDLSACSLIFTDNSNASIDLILTSNWTKYSFETAGTGRPIEIQFRLTCIGSNLPITIYLDDVAADACIPKKPNPECQVLPGTDNFLVNPGFECPGGITAWAGSSYYGYGNDSIAQFSGTSANPTHSGSGMAGLLLDGSQLPFPPSGVALFQYSVDDDLTRKAVKASFWLSVDAKLNNMSGCLLHASTTTGTYLLDVDISNLTTKWTKFEIKDINPTNYDTFEISIFGCTNLPQPLIYLDDVYFGIDRTAPLAPTTTTLPPEPTQTAGPCTTTPELIDPGFELDNTGNWLFFDNSPNFDTSFLVDSTSTYGQPKSGSGVGVLDFPSPNANLQILQQLFGLCNNQVYTATAWFYIPSGYDASVCTFSLGVFAGSGPVAPVAAGVWTKVSVVFLAALDSTSIYPYIYVGVQCQNTNEIVVLIDDITFGPGPACTVIPSISDGSFEGGNLTIWDGGVAEGDETIAITSAISRTGTKSLVLNFPSTSNGAGFSREFPVCVGGKYTFRLWYYVPTAYKGIQCFVHAYAWYTGEFVRDDVSVYNTWVEVKLDFLAGATTGHVDFGVSCLNQLKKVVIYIDDVSITTR